PAGLAALLWYPAFARTRGSGFDLAAHWVHGPLARFAPGVLVDGLFGGLRGPLEPILAIGVGAWLAASLATKRLGLRRVVDRPFLASAALLLTVFALAPDEYFNTLFFARRWLPAAAILVILALPRPRLPGWVTATVPLAMLAALSIRTADAWVHWE